MATGWLSDLGRDARRGLRLWRRRPGFAAVVLLTLGLGIGATTVMATLVESVLWKPLAFAHPERLVSVQEQTAGAPSAAAVAEGWGRIWALAGPNLADLVRSSRTLELGAWRYDGGIVSQPGPADYVDADEVNASLFPVLGVTPAAGRFFTAADDHVGAAPVAVVSRELAVSRFGSPAAAVGGRLHFADQIYTVVGVLPGGFDLAGFPTADAAQVYVPLGQDPSPVLQNRQAHPGLAAIGRLQPGFTLAAAQHELDVIARRLEARYPQSNAQRGFLARPLRADVGGAAATLWLLLGAAGLVLLLACANVACLLLTRSLARERELAMCAALGASRGRLVRQCLAESVLFGLGGGGLGLALAAAGLRPFLADWPGGLPRAANVALDGRVLGFALAAALVSGLIFGLAPAWRVPFREVEAVLRGGARTHTARGAFWQHALVAAQVGLAVVLLAGAGVLGRALLRLSKLDLGVRTDHVLTARVALPAAALANPASARAAWQALLTRVRAVPGVEAAATVDTVPLREGNDILNYWTGAAAPPADRQPAALATTVSPGYFRVMGIRLLAGRVITAEDRLGAAPVAVIDEDLARHAFAGRNPIGQAIHLGLGNDPLTIVGVVGHVRYWGPAGDDASPVHDQVYYAFAQLPDRFVPRWSELTSIAVRTSLPPGAVLPQIEAAVRGPGGDQAIYELRTLGQLARGSLAQQRFLLLLFGVFAGLALLLAGLGVYGVQAWLAAQRLPELAVRLALGARRGGVFWLVLRQSLAVVGLGLAAGMLAALGGGRVLRQIVAGVGGPQPATLAAAALLLVLAAAAASALPAWRAARADPMRTLRQE